MTKVTNLTRETMNFTTGTDGEGQSTTDHVLPGETKAIDVDPESPQVQGRILAGVIRIEGGKKTSAKQGASGAAGANPAA